MGFYPSDGRLSPQIIDLMSWINSGNLHVGWTLRVDQITAVMLVVVCTVSAMVHLYSVGYMQVLLDPKVYGVFKPFYF